MIHTNATNAVTEQALKRVPLIRPKWARNFWQGIKHLDLVTAIRSECEQRGWATKEAVFSLSKDRADMAGTFRIEIPSVEMPDDQRLELGLLTSNAMRRTLKLVVGTRVFVCMNGMVTGDVVLCKKHTTGFDLPEALHVAMDEYLEKVGRIPMMVKKMKDHTLIEAEVYEVLVETGRQGVMPWSLIGQVDWAYRNPAFTDFKPRTSWSLLNAFTQVVKKEPPLRQMDQINEFRQLLPVGRN
jgi:hypothetical protein